MPAPEKPEREEASSSGASPEAQEAEDAASSRNHALALARVLLARALESSSSPLLLSCCAYQASARAERPLAEGAEADDQLQKALRQLSEEGTPNYWLFPPQALASGLLAHLVDSLRPESEQNPLALPAVADWREYLSRPHAATEPENPPAVIDLQDSSRHAQPHTWWRGGGHFLIVTFGLASPFAAGDTATENALRRELEQKVIEMTDRARDEVAQQALADLDGCIESAARIGRALDNMEARSAATVARLESLLASTLRD